MRFKVYSARLTELEAGYAGHLEGVFKTLKDAEAYAETWRALYATNGPDFWVAE